MSAPIEIWLDKTSQPIVHEATSTYQKGDLFCVRDTDGIAYKYPVNNIFRVVEYTNNSSTADTKPSDKTIRRY